MASQGFEELVMRIPGLHPHLAAVSLCCVAAGPARRLHQEREEPLGGAEIARVKRRVGIDCGHQGNASEVMALGHHLRAHEHVDIARMNLGQLRFQRAFGSGGVRVDPGHPHRSGLTIPAGRVHAAQKLGDLLFELLGAPAHRRDIHIAAARACARNALTQAAVVTAKGAVDLVEDPEGAAVGAVAFPVAGGTGQDRGIAPPVQKNQGLLAEGDPLGNGFQQRGGEEGALRLQVHVHQAHLGQYAGAHPLGHCQTLVTPSLAGLPAFQ